MLTAAKHTDRIHPQSVERAGSAALGENWISNFKERRMLVSRWQDSSSRRSAFVLPQATRPRKHPQRPTRNPNRQSYRSGVTMNVNRLANSASFKSLAPAKANSTLRIMNGPSSAVRPALVDEFPRIRFKDQEHPRAFGWLRLRRASHSAGARNCRAKWRCA